MVCEGGPRGLGHRAMKEGCLPMAFGTLGTGLNLLADHHYPSELSGTNESRFLPPEVKMFSGTCGIQTTWTTPPLRIWMSFEPPPLLFAKNARTRSRKPRRPAKPRYESRDYEGSAADWRHERSAGRDGALIGGRTYVWSATEWSSGCAVAAGNGCSRGATDEVKLHAHRRNSD
jgi:hypothetical protein